MGLTTKRTGYTPHDYKVQDYSIPSYGNDGHKDSAPRMTPQPPAGAPVHSGSGAKDSMPARVVRVDRNG